MSDFAYEATYPKARKEHRCEMCGRVIGVGEKYRRQGGVYDGLGYTTLVCLQCEAFAQVLHRAGFENDEGGWPWISELDQSEVAYVGLSREFQQFLADWRGLDGNLIEPMPVPSRTPASQGSQP